MDEPLEAWLAVEGGFSTDWAFMFSARLSGIAGIV